MMDKPGLLVLDLAGGPLDSIGGPSVPRTACPVLRRPCLACAACLACLARLSGAGQGLLVGCHGCARASHACLVHWFPPWGCRGLPSNCGCGPRDAACASIPLGGTSTTLPSRLASISCWMGLRPHLTIPMIISRSPPLNPSSSPDSSSLILIRIPTSSYSSFTFHHALRISEFLDGSVVALQQ